MVPTWMIQDVERQRRERERDRPVLHVELPLPQDEEVPAIPAPLSSPIVIEFGDEASAA